MVSKKYIYFSFFEHFYNLQNKKIQNVVREYNKYVKINKLDATIITELIGKQFFRQKNK